MDNFEEEDPYIYYKGNLTAISSKPNSLTFSTFYYKGVTLEGTCDAWTTYTDTQLQIPLSDVDITTVEMWFQIYDYAKRVYRREDCFLEASTVINPMIDALVDRTNYQFFCSSNTIRVFHCNDRPIVCANCKQVCVNTEACPGRSFLVNPCQQNCETHTGSAAIINFQYVISRPYPVFVAGPRVTEVSSSSLTVAFDVDKQGDVFCGAFEEDPSSVTVVEIRDQGFMRSITSSDATNATVDITGLVPDTDYHVMCFTQSFRRDLMRHAVVQQTLMQNRTACCRGVTFDTTHSVILDVESTVASTAAEFDVFEFSLSSIPSARTVVNITVNSVACTMAANAAIASPNQNLTKADPQSFEFAADTLVTSGQFTIQGYAGCYRVGVFVGSTDSYDTSETTFLLEIYDPRVSIAPAPAVKQAIFSNSGLALLIVFDSDTNRASSTSSNSATATAPASFTCSNLLNYRDASDASCRWLSPTTLQATMGASPVTVPGDAIELFGGIVAPLCSVYSDTALRCLNFTYTNNTVLVLAAPASPSQPVATLVGPRMISFCDNIILDPTSSFGNAGRDWLSVQWSASGVTVPNQNSTLLGAYLNQNYPDVRYLVTIPNTLLALSEKTRFWEITLQLTNFLGQTSTATQRVSIRYDTESMPSVAVVGIQNAPFYRWQNLDLFAQSELSVCGNLSAATPVAYKWSVYRGTRLQQQLVSNALDQRFYRLNPFALDAGANYTFQVELVVYTATGLRLKARNRRSLLTGNSKLVANIAGGMTRTATVSKVIDMDASGSSNPDDPSGADLSYSWDCIQKSPTFGATCPGFDPEDEAVWTIFQNQLTAGVTYRIRVTVSSTAGQFATATQDLAVVTAAVPILSINTPALKYNVGSKLILTATVNTSTNAATAEWDSPTLPEFASLGVALTPLQKAVTAPGSITFPLALAAGSFQPGASYIFRLRATYTNTRRPNYATTTVEVVMNEPPSGGILEISPATGTELITQYTFSAPLWTDDLSDYPLSYVLSYYTLTSLKQNVIKNAGPLAHVTTIMGRGLRSLQFVNIGVANVSDIYGSFDTAEDSVQVFPLQGTTRRRRQLSGQLTTLEAQTATERAIQATGAYIANALLNVNPTAVKQAIDAALVSINSVDCGTALECSLINRQECSTTPGTCGPCLDGYVGDFGDSNFPCRLRHELQRIGQNCTANSSCITNICLAGFCADASKPCVDDCSGRGTCEYFDANGQELMHCSVRNPSCTARCNCEPGRFGRNCGLGETRFGQLLGFRTSLCSDLLRIVPIQDVSLDVVRSRAIAVKEALLDPFVVTDAALNNCTEALAQTIISNPEISCAGDNFVFLVDAFSTALDVGRDATQEALASITSGLTALVEGCQLSSAVEEAPTQFASRNLRIAVVLLQQIADRALPVPQTSLESFEDVLFPSVRIGSSFSSTPSFSADSLLAADTTAVGVAVVQITSNPRNELVNASSITVESIQYADGSNSRRRQLASVAAGAEGAESAGAPRLHAVNGGGRRSLADQALPFGVTITLPNINPINYFSRDNFTLQLFCEKRDGKTYKLRETCPSGLEVEVDCPDDNDRGFFEVTCPGRRELPQCTVWDGSQYVANPDCTLLSFTAEETICYCRGEAARRYLQSSSMATSQEFSTIIMSFDDPYSERFVQYSDLLDVEENIVIFVTLMTTLALFLAGLVFFVYWDKTEHLEVEKMKGKSTHSARTVQGFFNALIPDEFRPGPWKQLLMKRVMLEHSWFSALAPYREDRGFRSNKWALAMGKLLSFLLITTIIAAFLFADDGYCERFEDKGDCNDERSWAGILHACEWNDKNESCIYRRPDVNFTTIVIFVVAVAVVTVPVGNLIEVLLRRLFRMLAERRKERHALTFLEEIEMKGAAAPNNRNAEHKNKDVVPIFPLQKGGSPSSSMVMGSTTSAFNGTAFNGPVQNAAAAQMDEFYKQSDELQDVERLPAKLLKYARLRKIQRVADFALPYTETEHLSVRSDQDYAYYGRRELAIGRGQWEECEGSQTVQHDRYRMKLSSITQLQRSVLLARSRAEYIKSEMEYMPTTTEKENYLMKQFIVDTFHGYQRNIAARYFLGSVQSTKYSQFYLWLRRLSLLLLPLIFGVMIYYVLILDLGIGSRATDMWLIVVFVTLGEDIFILQPLKIWLKWVVLNSYVSEDAFHLCVALKLRYASVVNRQHGIMRDANSLLQHFNPACRAARLFPDLPVARFLISLNDYDVPFFRIPDYSQDLAVTSCLRSTAAVAVYLLTMLPFSLQDTIVDVVGIIVINLIALAFYLLGRLVLGLAVAIVVILALLFCLRETKYLDKLRQKKTKINKRDIILKKYLPQPAPVSHSAETVQRINDEFDSKVLFKSRFKALDEHEAMRLGANKLHASNQQLGRVSPGANPLAFSPQRPGHDSSAPSLLLAAGAAGTGAHSMQGSGLFQLQMSPAEPSATAGRKSQQRQLGVNQAPSGAFDPDQLQTISHLSSQHKMALNRSQQSMNLSQYGTAFTLAEPRESMPSSIVPPLNARYLAGGRDQVPDEKPDADLRVGGVDQVPYVDESDAERRAKRKSAKKSKKRSKHSGGGGDEGGGGGGGGGGGAYAGGSGGADADETASARRRHRRRDRHRHRESEAGGPGLSSARRYEVDGEDETGGDQQDCARTGSGTGSRPSPSRQQSQQQHMMSSNSERSGRSIMFADGTSELPPHDYFSGSMRTSQGLDIPRTSTGAPGLGPGAGGSPPRQRSGPGSAMSPTRSSQFPSWH